MLKFKWSSRKIDHSASEKITNTWWHCMENLRDLGRLPISRIVGSIAQHDSLPEHITEKSHEAELANTEARNSFFIPRNPIQIQRRFKRWHSDYISVCRALQYEIQTSPIMMYEISELHVDGAVI
jgi:hypothetical protein